MFPGKRRHHEDWHVDLPFLLNAESMLTEEEFLCKMPSQSYTNYMGRFLRRRVVDVFERNVHRQWFRDRYLRESNSDIQPSFASSKFILLRDIAGDAPIESLASELQCISGVVGVYASQNDGARGFTRDMYLNLSPGIDPESVVVHMEQGYSPVMFDMAVDIAENYLASLSQLESVYAVLCHLNNFDENSMFDSFFMQGEKTTEKSVQSYTEILRNVFNFCTTCCRQYDNRCAMVFHCSKHTVQNFCSRALDLLGCTRDFPYTDISPCEGEQERLVSRTPEGRFRCIRCAEIFLSMELVTSHLASRHKELWESIGREHSSFTRFLGRIDPFILTMIQGYTDRVTPPYATVTTDKSTVVYDMPEIFSGDIVFD